MVDKPDSQPPVEVVPSVEGGISAIGSATAPFIYFEDAAAFGHLPGIVRVTLTAGRILPTPDQRVATDHIVVAHLRMNLLAAASLKDALERALAMASQPPPACCRRSRQGARGRTATMNRSMGSCGTSSWIGRSFIPCAKPRC